MGLSYFAQTCSAEATLKAAQVRPPALTAWPLADAVNDRSGASQRKEHAAESARIRAWEHLLRSLVPRLTTLLLPNRLASIGTRVGLTFTIFFATAVTVVDGAEAPFIFVRLGPFRRGRTCWTHRKLFLQLTTTLQALAYIITILQAGLTGDGISRCAYCVQNRL